MKVKVRNKTYDSGKEPVMIILNDQDKLNIAKMPKDAHKYCCVPETMREEKARKFVETTEGRVVVAKRFNRSYMATENNFGK